MSTINVLDRLNKLYNQKKELVAKLRIVDLEIDKYLIMHQYQQEKQWEEKQHVK